MRTVASVIVLNGTSSSGKTSIARGLVELLDEPWITLGVDDLLGALAPSLVGKAPCREGRRPLLGYDVDGTVQVEPAWRSVEAAWHAGVAAIARAGIGVILDEVLLDGVAAQQRIARALGDLSLCWVGVHCEPAVAAARERSRPDRVAGMAASQVGRVHEGVRYDLVVNTTATSSEACARVVLGHLRRT